MHADPMFSGVIESYSLAVKWPSAPRSELPNPLVFPVLSLHVQFSPYLSLNAIMIPVLILGHFIHFHHHLLSATTPATSPDLFWVFLVVKATPRSAKIAAQPESPHISNGRS